MPEFDYVGRIALGILQNLVDTGKGWIAVELLNRAQAAHRPL